MRHGTLSCCAAAAAAAAAAAIALTSPPLAAEALMTQPPRQQQHQHHHHRSAWVRRWADRDPSSSSTHRGSHQGEAPPQQPHHHHPNGAPAPAAADRDALAAAFGVGKGKHAGKRRRSHANKYAAASSQPALDPWEQQLRAAAGGGGLGGPAVLQTEAQALFAEQATGAQQERHVRGQVEFPDEEAIDPYDPTTFGFVEVGVVLGAHGVRGELKVRCSTGFGDERLCRAGGRHIKAPNRRYPRKVRLESGRLQREDVYIVSLEGVSSREQAAKLREHVLYAADDERPELEDDEFMIADLVGLRAYLDPGRTQYVGEVAGVVVMDDLGVVAGKGQDLLEMELPPLAPGGPLRMCYVPLVEDIVPVVDVHEGYLLLEPPVGLLDLAVAKTEKVVIRGLLPSSADD